MLGSLLTGRLMLCGTLGLLAPFMVLASDREGGATLQERMDRADFEAAGLHRLDPDELAHLNAWLFGTPTAETEEAEEPATPSEQPAVAAVPAEERTVSREVPDLGAEQVRQRRSETARDEPEALTSRIDGEFRGWSGNTAFRLQNGQIWQQRGTTSRYFYLADSPEVRIHRGAFGYHLTVVETGRSVPVQRIH